MQHRQPSISSYSQAEEFPSIESVCGNSLMIKINSIIDNHQISIKEINSENVNFNEKIADGLFDSIHLGELKLSNNEKQNVIIKSLNDNTEEKQK